MVASTYTGQTGFAPKEENVSPGSYLKLFDSITQYQTESGLGTALKGAATLLDKSIDAAQSMYINDKQREVENRIEPIVEGHTQDLEDASAYLRAKTRPIASQQYATNLLPGPEGGSPAGTPVQGADAPPDQIPDNAKVGVQQNIKETADYIDSLKAGVAQGKISDVYFRGAIANEAKDIRNNTLVGYRPDVDHMIATKMHSVQANPYIESLIHDINTSLSAGKSEKNATLGTLRSHIGVPGVDNIFEDRDNDRITDSEAMHRLSVPLQQDYLIKQAKQQLEYRGELLKVNTAYAEKNVNTIASANAMIAHSAQTSSQGITSKDLDQMAIDAANNKHPLNRERAQYLAGQSESIRQAVYNKTLADLNEVHTDEKTGEKYTYASLTSPGYAIEAAKKASEHWANQRDAFYKGDLSAATFNTRLLDAAKEDTMVKGAFDHPEAMAAATLAKMLKDHGLPEQTIHQTLSESGAIPKLNAMVAKAKYELALPDEIRGSLPAGQTTTTTFKGQLANIKAVYDANGIEYKSGAQNITDFTKIIDGKVGVSLVNTNDPRMIDTIAHHVFGPGNENAFKYFNENTYTAKGDLIPGSQALFNRFSHPDVVKQIMKGSAQTQAEYKNFMTITAREDLLRNDLPQLKEYVNTPNAPYKIGWDTDTKNITIETNPNIDIANRSGLATGKVQLNKAVSNINTVLDGLRSIAETQGKKDLDVDAFVLAPVMQSLGDISDVKGLPSALALTIKGAYAKQKFEQDASQAQGNKDKYANPPKAGK